MDVIRVDANLFKFYGITLFDFFADRVERLFAVKNTKDGSSILYGGHEVVMDLIGIVFRLLDRSHTLHTLP